MRCAYNQCNLLVAAHDPERVQVGLETFHKPCLRKHQQAEQQEEQKRLHARVGVRHKDPYFRIESARMQ